MIRKKNIYTKYKPEFCNALIEYGAKGHIWTTFAAEIKVSRSTLYEWVKKYAEFAEAKEVADVLCEQYWEKKGMKPRAKDFHFGVYKMMMTNKFGYSEKPKEKEAEKEKVVIVMPPLEKE